LPFPASTVQNSLTAKVNTGLHAVYHVAVMLIVSQGELRHINKLRYWPLDAVLNDKYLFPKEDADAIAGFLTPMLRLHPDKRAKASDLMHHNWLDGIIVQGEIDVIRHAEEDEARRKQAEAVGVDGSKDMPLSSKLQAALDQSEADAMKPVDDIAVLSDSEKIASPPPPQVHQALKLSNAPVPTSALAKENAKTRGVSSGSGSGTAEPQSRPNSSSKPPSSAKRAS
jgi:serine/threonine-protein kinase SRPK3